MALWGAEVKPGQEYVHKISQAYGRLRITRAILGNPNNSSWSTLEAKVGHERHAKLCRLHPISMPMCSLEYELEEDKNVTFSVEGPNSVYLSGYYILSKPQTCTIPRTMTHLKGTHQEMPDRGQNSKKARREDVSQASGQIVLKKSVEDGNLRHDADHESDDEEWNDGTQKTKDTPRPPLRNKKNRNDATQKTKDTPLPPLRNKKKAVKKPSVTLTISDIQQISDTDDEKETILKAEKEQVLQIECTTKGCPDAKVAGLGSKVRVKFVGSLRNGEVFDEGESYQFMLGAGIVIPGWELGIKGQHLDLEVSYDQIFGIVPYETSFTDMLVGEERRLTIPPRLGYGGVKQDKIPQDSWLIYKIKLLEVE